MHVCQVKVSLGHSHYNARASRGILIALVVGILVAAGVTGVLWWLHREKVEAQERAYQHSIGVVRKMINGGGWTDVECRAYERILRLLERREAGNSPIMGAVWLASLEGKLGLSMGFVDVDGDVEGIRITVINTQTGKRTTEDYPIFLGDMPKGWRLHPYKIINFEPVTIRVTGAERKDEELWSKWARKYPSSDCPPMPIWINVPSDSCRVEVAVYDAKRHVSEPMPVRVTADPADLPVRAAGK